MSISKIFLSIIAFQLGAWLGVRAQSFQHEIGLISVQTGGSVIVELTGNAPAQFRPYFDLYLLDASTNLRDWQPLSSILRTNISTNALFYIEADAVSNRQRFYRVVTNSLPTPLPRPTGPYPVGVISRLLTDPSRTNRYNIKTNSSFMISLWFPAASSAGTLPARYIEPQIASTFASIYGVSGSVMSGAYAQSSPSSAVITSPTPHPVVIYSHGFGIGRRDNTAKIEELASHGYIVVSIDHADCAATVFPDGQRLTSVISGLSRALFTNDVMDVQFVLTTLTRMNVDDQIFANTMDLKHVGTMGWSYGGGVAAEICRTDDRVLATVLLDAYLQNAIGVIEYGVQKPFLGIYSVAQGGTMAPFHDATHDPRSGSCSDLKFG